MRSLSPNESEEFGVRAMVLGSIHLCSGIQGVSVGIIRFSPFGLLVWGGVIVGSVI